jgi:hypothetical protein
MLRREIGERALAFIHKGSFLLGKTFLLAQRVNLDCPCVSAKRKELGG